jgi:hypothetical protein
MGKFFVISHNKQTTRFLALPLSSLPPQTLPRDFANRTTRPTALNNDNGKCTPHVRRVSDRATTRTVIDKGLVEAQCASSLGMFFISLFNKITID